MSAHTESSAGAPTHAGTGPAKLRPPCPGDGNELHRLVSACPPLDLNSLYAYLLLSHHFSATSVVAEDSHGSIVGYISGYRKPEDPTVLFIWQVAVHPDARGQSLASRMLDNLLDRQSAGSVRFIETSITPSNRASWKLFRSAARRWIAPCAESPLFSEEEFGSQNHEREDLLRIGPFNNQRREQQP